MIAFGGRVSEVAVGFGVGARVVENEARGPDFRCTGTNNTASRPRNRDETYRVVKGADPSTNANDKQLSPPVLSSNQREGNPAEDFCKSHQTEVQRYRRTR